MIQRFAQSIMGTFRYHKLKLFVAFAGALLFSFLRFPFDDLADVLSTKISEATQGQVFCQFDSLGLALFPQPSLSLANVSIDTSLFSGLKADRLKLSVSVPALLAFKMGFVVDASGLFGGQADLSFREGDKTKDGQRKFLINFDAEKLSLADFKKVADLPVQLKGAMNAKLNTVIDPGFTDQPEGEVELKFASLEMPASSVATPFGPMNLPTLKWSNVTLKGRLVGGKFIIEDGKIGSAQDPLNGQLKGQMDLRVMKVGAQPITDASNYDLRVEINVNKSVEREFGLFLSFLDAFKSPGLNGSRYLFRASGSRFGIPPRLTALTAFN